MKDYARWDITSRSSFALIATPGYVVYRRSLFRFFLFPPSQAANSLDPEVPINKDCLRFSQSQSSVIVYILYELIHCWFTVP